MVSRSKYSSFSTEDAANAAKWNPENFNIIDFDTVPAVEAEPVANEIISTLCSLSKPQQLCFFLYYYSLMSPKAIADVLDTSEANISGALFSSTDKVLSVISSIQRSNPMLHYVTVESTLPWALRHNSAYAPSESELKVFYSSLVDKLVDSKILDTAMTDEDISELVDIDIKDMEPLPEPSIFKSRIFPKILIVAGVIVILAGFAVGMQRVREYNAMRAQIENQTSRTTLKYSMSVIPTEHLIFSTEYGESSEAKASDEDTTEESEKITTVPDESEDLGGLSYSESGGGITITGFDNSSVNVTIPDKIKGKPVTAIASNAFFNTNISSLTMPNSISVIGSGAFYDCSGLHSITISSKVTKLEENTFRGCTALSSVTLPSGLTSIGTQAFYKCSSLKSITLPPSLTTLGDWAFANCTAMTKIAIPDKVTTLGKSLFHECTQLAECSFSSASRVAALGESMFFSCSALKGFVIPSSVKSIPANCFYGCKAMTGIGIPYSLSSIGENAFNDCTSLKAVGFTSNLKRIGASAFSGCSSLARIDLQIGTNYIGASAFSGCSSMTAAVVPATVTEIGPSAFADCPQIVISCKKDSYAESYAITNNLSYVSG